MLSGQVSIFKLLDLHSHVTALLTHACGQTMEDALLHIEWELLIHVYLKDNMGDEKPFQNECLLVQESCQIPLL